MVGARGGLGLNGARRAGGVRVPRVMRRLSRGRPTLEGERFDAALRRLGAGTSRRGALGLLAGLAGLMLATPSALAKRKGKKKGKSRKSRKRARLQAAPGCFTRTICQVGRLKNASNCDFGGSNAFAGKDLWKANLSNANLRGVDATGANFTDANLSGACLVETILKDANLTRTNLGGAVLCRTVMPDGSKDNSGCGSPTPCCPTCIELGQPCGGDLGGSCCGNVPCSGGPGTPGVCACPADAPNLCPDGVCRQCCTNGQQSTCAKGLICSSGACVCPPPPPSGNACLATGGPTCFPVETIDGCDLCGNGLTCDPCDSSDDCPGANGLCVKGCANPDPIFVCGTRCGAF
jgi:hypothetical protein